MRILGKCICCDKLVTEDMQVGIFTIYNRPIGEITAAPTEVALEFMRLYADVLSEVLKQELNAAIMAKRL